MLTLIGVIINVGAAWALGYGRFILAGVLIMLVANIFDFIDGKVAHRAAAAVARSARSGTRRSTASRISRCSPG